ncbi:MAG: mercury resistance system transport protein MerF [Nitrospinota bacterium]
MNCKSLMKCGISGTVVTAICCFTPILAVLLGAAGFSVWLGWLDYVLFPLLAGFIGLTAYAAYRMRKERCTEPDRPEPSGAKR